jgi:hypothetical protein
MADTGSIVTDAEVQDYLDISSLDNKTALIVKAAEAFWFGDLDRAFIEASYTTLHDINPSQNVLLLEDRPVTEFTKLEYVSSRASDGTPTYIEYDGDEYVVDSEAGIVRKLSGSFPAGAQEIRSTYTAGFTAAQIAATSHYDIAILKSLLCWSIARQHMLITGGPKMHMRSSTAPEGGSTSYQFGLTAYELEARAKLWRGAIA